MKKIMLAKRAVLAIVVAIVVTTAAQAHAQEQLNVAIYAPSASFADSGQRLAYIQGLARAIQQKTGIPTTGKAYVRLADLTGAKPDFAVIDGICIAAKSPGQVLATAQIGGDTSQSWGLYTRGGELVPALKGKKLAFVNTGCRDNDFIENALLESEIKTKSFFGALVDKPDVTGAIATVKDFKAADAVFAPVALGGKGLTKVFDGTTVPNPGFVVLVKGLPAATVDKVKDAVLGYGASGGIDGWKAAASYSALAGKLGARVKRPVLAPPEPVRLDDSDVLIIPTSEYHHAAVKQHFWDPGATAQ